MGAGVSSSVRLEHKVCASYKCVRFKSRFTAIGDVRVLPLDSSSENQRITDGPVIRARKHILRIPSIPLCRYRNGDTETGVLEKLPCQKQSTLYTVRNEYLEQVFRRRIGAKPCSSSTDVPV